MGVISLLIAYLLGGLTFLPALAVLAYYAFTVSYAADSSLPSDSLPRPTWDDEDILRKDAEGLPPEVKLRARNDEAASGYFAVTREYVPGGISGKPPERQTAAGGAVAVESPSVYQSMYRSIFDRNRQSGPSMETNRGNVRANRRAKNVFFIALRSVPLAFHRWHELT